MRRQRLVATWPHDSSSQAVLCPPAPGPSCHESCWDEHLLTQLPPLDRSPDQVPSCAHLGGYAHLGAASPRPRCCPEEALPCLRELGSPDPGLPVLDGLVTVCLVL